MGGKADRVCHFRKYAVGDMSTRAFGFVALSNNTIPMLPIWKKHGSSNLGCICFDHIADPPLGARSRRVSRMSDATDIDGL
jgi:hypothetical protein